MAHTLSLQHTGPHVGVPIPSPRYSERTERAMAQSEAFCRARGARLTPIRRRVLELLHGFDKPLGAYDLVELLGSQGHRMAPITVYRALDFLIEQGLAHRLASRNAFVACPHGHGPGDLVALLICEACGDVNEIASPDVADTVTRVLREQDYQPRSRILEITGRCGHCRDVH